MKTEKRAQWECKKVNKREDVPRALHTFECDSYDVTLLNNQEEIIIET